MMPFQGYMMRSSDVSAEFCHRPDLSGLGVSLTRAIKDPASLELMLKEFEPYFQLR